MKPKEPIFAPFENDAILVIEGKRLLLPESIGKLVFYILKNAEDLDNMSFLLGVPDKNKKRIKKKK